KIMSDYEISKGIKYMEKALELLTKQPNLVVYGVEHVKNASEMGAIDIILVIEDMISNTDEEKRIEIEKILEDVENKRGEVILVPKESPIYYQLKSLTGILGILRFSIN
ncbi:mRNA surveillance protein Pelota, partial [Sulfolobus sp. E5]